MIKKVLVVLGIILLSMLFLSGCKKNQSGGAGTITLTYYKLYDEEDTIRAAAEAYEREHPNVRIRYRKFVDPEKYEDLILNELAEGEGPDIFEVSNFSLPRYLKKITPLDSSSYTPQVFRDAYVAVAGEDFVKTDPKDGKEKIYGIPLSIDTPVLYYNKQIFEAKLPEKGKPGALWDDILQEAFLLREEEADEDTRELKLLRGGIALGRADNIMNASSILLNLMMQNGVSFYDGSLRTATFASGAGERAVTFYTGFADPKLKQFSWDDVSSNELEAFLSGRVAVMVGYSDLLPKIDNHLQNFSAKGFKVISKNDIGIAPFPQHTDNLEEKTVVPQYFAQTVSRTSKNSFAAWDFISFLTSRDQARRYLEKTSKPAARRDLLNDQKRDRNLSVFVSQLGFAKSIPMFNERKYREILTEAIQKVAEGQVSASKALGDAQSAINNLIPEGGMFP